MGLMMFSISNNAKNRASVWGQRNYGYSPACCTPFAPGTVELNLHSQFPFKSFQKTSNSFFDGKPTFPEHGECCQDFGGGPFE